jgi:monooxygenase
MSNERFDVVIVGAGTGGLFLAWLLGRKGLKVAVIDRGSGPRPIPRGEILQPNGLAILDREGLLDLLVGPAGPFRVERFRFSKTDRTPLCTVDYRLLPPPYNYGLIGLPHLLQEIVLKRISETPTVRLFWSGSFLGFQREAKEVTVKVKHGDRESALTCRLLVGGDGARSEVREALRIPARVHSYRDGYLTLVVPRPPGFESEGRYYLGRREILGFFPVSTNQLYLFYLIPRAALEGMRRRGSDALKDSILRIDSSVPLDGFSSFEQVAFMPCHRVRARRWVADCAALIGDAAHAMNPHVAQGTNQAIEDAVALARVAVDCFRRGEFGAGALAEYEWERRPVASALQRIGDELTLLWNAGFPPLVRARERVFRTVDRNPRLKKKMLHAVAGLNVSPYTLIDRLEALGLFPRRRRRD